MNIQVNLLEDNSVRRFKIVGEIDAFTAPVLKERLTLGGEIEGLKAELDLSEVNYMDSTGLGVFVGFYKTIKSNGGQLKITGVNKRLKRLFEITGLDEIMDIETDEGGDMMQPYDYIEIRVPAKAQYVGVARLTISGLASRLGFTYDEIEDLKIASSEAITNAVQHAYKDDEQGEVIVGCALFEDRMEIMVADHGKSFDFEETKKRVGPYNENEEARFLREGGLGLYLMETLMDDVKVHHEEGVTVFMTKYLGGERGDEDVERTVSS